MPQVDFYDIQHTVDGILGTRRVTGLFKTKMTKLEKIVILIIFLVILRITNGFSCGFWLKIIFYIKWILRSLTRLVMLIFRQRRSGKHFTARLVSGLG